MKTTQLDQHLIQYQKAIDRKRNLGFWSAPCTRALTLGGTALVVASLPLAHLYEWPININALIGTGLILSALYLDQVLLSSYLYYYQKKSESSVFGSKHYKQTDINYEVAALLTHYPDDLTRGFMESQIGMLVAKRLGLSTANLSSFFASGRVKIPRHVLVWPNNTTLDHYTMAQAIATLDKDFHTWLETQKVHTTDFVEATSFVSTHAALKRKQKQLFGRDHLSTYPTLFTKLRAANIEQLPFVSILKPTKTSTHLVAAKKILDAILAKRDNNLLLIGSADEATSAIANAHYTSQSTALMRLQNYTWCQIDFERITQSGCRGAALTNFIIATIKKLEAYPYTILVLGDITKMITVLTANGADCETIIDALYIESKLHLIAHTSAADINTVRNIYREITKRSTEITIDNDTCTDILLAKTEIIANVEDSYKKTFAYTALQSLAAALQKPQDYSFEILFQAVAKSSTQTFITQTDAENIITHAYSQLIANDEAKIVPYQITNLERSLRERTHNLITYTQECTSLRSLPRGIMLVLGNRTIVEDNTWLDLAKDFGASEKCLLRLEANEFFDQKQIAQKICAQLEDYQSSLIIIDNIDNLKVADSIVKLLASDQSSTTLPLGHSLVVLRPTVGTNLIYKTAALRQQEETLVHELTAALIKKLELSRSLVDLSDEIIVLDEPRLDEYVAYLVQTIVRQQQHYQKSHYQITISGETLQALISLLLSKKDGELSFMAIDRLVKAAIDKHIISGEAKRETVTTLRIEDFTH